MGMALAPTGLSGSATEITNNGGVTDVFAAVRAGVLGEASNVMGKRMSFFPSASASTSTNKNALKRVTSASSVTVANQGFVFFHDGNSRGGNTVSADYSGNQNSASGVWGNEGDQHFGAGGLSNMGNTMSESNAPGLKRQRSNGNISALVGSDDISSGIKGAKSLFSAISASGVSRSNSIRKNP